MENNGVLCIKGKFIIEYNEEKQVVTISTPKKNKIEISDTAESIKLTDQHRNEIVMDSSGITLNSAKDIKLKANKGIQIEAGTSLKAKAGANLNLEGRSIEGKAQTSLKMAGTANAEFSASGQTVVKGAIVMIN